MQRHTLLLLLLLLLRSEPWQYPQVRTELGTGQVLICVAAAVAHLNGIVTTDGAWLAGLWVGGANHLAASQHNVPALPDLAAQMHSSEVTKQRQWCVRWTAGR